MATRSLRCLRIPTATTAATPLTRILTLASRDRTPTYRSVLGSRLPGIVAHVLLTPRLKAVSSTKRAHHRLQYRMTAETILATVAQTSRYFCKPLPPTRLREIPAPSLVAHRATRLHLTVQRLAWRTASRLRNPDSSAGRTTRFRPERG